jgi:hypothetical protein
MRPPPLTLFPVLSMLVQAAAGGLAGQLSTLSQLHRVGELSRPVSPDEFAGTKRSVLATAAVATSTTVVAGPVPRYAQRGIHMRQLQGQQGTSNNSNASSAAPAPAPTPAAGGAAAAVYSGDDVKNLMRGKSIRVVLKLDPAMVQNATATPTPGSNTTFVGLQYEGFAIEVLDKIAMKAGFRYQIVRASKEGKGGSWGNAWNDMAIWGPGRVNADFFFSGSFLTAGRQAIADWCGTLV